VLIGRVNGRNLIGRRDHEHTAIGGQDHPERVPPAARSAIEADAVAQNRLVRREQRMHLSQHVGHALPATPDQHGHEPREERRCDQQRASGEHGAEREQWDHRGVHQPGRARVAVSRDPHADHRRSVERPKRQREHAGRPRDREHGKAQGRRSRQPDDHADRDQGEEDQHEQQRGRLSEVRGEPTRVVLHAHVPQAEVYDAMEGRLAGS
jgi:hypothetical protein